MPQSDETLLAIETLVHSNCLTLADALEMAYLAGHRKAVKELSPTQLVPIVGGGGLNVSSSSTIGIPPVK